MMNPAIAMANEQLTRGCTLGQQAMFAESQSNYPVAAQMYDQAIGWIQQSMATAQMSGMFVPDHVCFTSAFAHFSAARAKNVLGWKPMAWSHLNQALALLNQAVAMNPRVVQYHVAAGTVLMSLGNLPEAERAFHTALQMNPTESWSQYMLSLLNSARGNMTAANQYYAAVQQVAPHLPPMPTPSLSSPGMQTGGGSGQNSKDWMSTVSNACKMLNNVFETVGNFQNMMQQF